MKSIHAAKAPAAIGPYSQAIFLPEGLCFISGQLPLNTATNTIACKSVEEQVHQVLDNIKHILAEVGMTFHNVVKTTIYLTDLNNFETVNSIYGSYFDGTKMPARECVEVSKLPKEALVEISVIAYKKTA